MKFLAWVLRWFRVEKRRHWLLGGGMPVQVGKGRFVSVYVKGDNAIELKDERTKHVIRLVPYQPNHGLMVEYYDADGNMSWRAHADFRHFAAMDGPASEVEE